MLLVNTINKPNKNTEEIKWANLQLKEEDKNWNKTDQEQSWEDERNMTGEVGKRRSF